MESVDLEVQAGVFERLQPWKQYRQRTSQVFGSDHSLRWFIRQHEQALVEAGALVKLTNGTYIDPVPFSAMALALMQGGPAAATAARALGRTHTWGAA